MLMKSICRRCWETKGVKRQFIEELVNIGVRYVDYCLNTYSPEQRKQVDQIKSKYFTQVYTDKSIPSLCKPCLQEMINEIT